MEKNTFRKGGNFKLTFMFYHESSVSETGMKSTAVGRLNRYSHDGFMQRFYCETSRMDLSNLVGLAN